MAARKQRSTRFQKAVHRDSGEDRAHESVGSRGGCYGEYQLLEQCFSDPHPCICKLLDRHKLIDGIAHQMNEEEKKVLLDKLYLHAVQSRGKDSNPAGFGTLSTAAMKRLMDAGKKQLSFEVLPMY